VDNQDGSTPLTNTRLETFCKLIACEEKTQADAWAQSSPTPITFESASHGGYRSLRRQNVADRVAWLRKERAHAASLETAPPLSNDPLAIMATVSDVLKQAYLTAKKEGYPAAKLAMVRKAWSLHISRQSAMQDLRKGVQDSSGTAASADFWDRIEVCTCPK
jgi:hypothetical protein